MDFVGKPFVPDVLLSRVRRTLELERYRSNLEILVEEQAKLLAEKTNRLNEVQEHIIVGMANLIESRDGSTGKQCEKYPDLCKAYCE